MFAGLGTRVRTFWQDQRGAFARLVGRDSSINREATATHYAAVFRRERDEALAEVERLRNTLPRYRIQVGDAALVTIRPTPQEVRWAFDNDIEAGAMFEFRNVGRTRSRPLRTALYRDTEQEDL